MALPAGQPARARGTSDVGVTVARRVRARQQPRWAHPRQSEPPTLDSEDAGLGPIDLVVLEFHSDGRRREPAQILLQLVDDGVLRVLDVVAVRKDIDGEVAAAEVGRPAGGEADGFASFAGASTGLIGEADIANIGDVLDPDSTAFVVLVEHAWVAPLTAAARRSAGTLVMHERMPLSWVIKSLDAVE